MRIEEIMARLRDSASVLEKNLTAHQVKYIADFLRITADRLQREGIEDERAENEEEKAELGRMTKMWAGHWIFESEGFRNGYWLKYLRKLRAQGKSWPSSPWGIPS